MFFDMPQRKCDVRQLDDKICGLSAAVFLDENGQARLKTSVTEIVVEGSSIDSAISKMEEAIKAKGRES